MADAYLNVAERVLQMARRPLRPREIIQTAYAQSLLPWHLHGARQDKTLHARISEDVARNPEASRFFRTGPGIFFLNEYLANPEIPDPYKQIYYAPPRRKTLRRDRILTVQEVHRVAHGDAFWPVQNLTSQLGLGRYAYLSYEEALRSSDAAVIYSFVLVFFENQVLSYRCGKFAPSSDPLYGRRSIGLGGAVYASDHDFLFQSMHGIVASGINELGFGIGLPRKLSERARYQNEVKPFLCTLLPGEDARPAILHVILAYECPSEFMPSKAALSINDLRWAPTTQVLNDLSDFDETSRRLYASGDVERLRILVAANARA